MPVFNYKARAADGASQTGSLTAPSRESALRELTQAGVFPTELVQTEGGASSAQATAVHKPRKHRAPVKDVAAFTRNLSTLILAGVPLLKALGVAQQHCESPGLKAASQDVTARVKAGESFAGALGDHERIFGRVYTSIVHAGEAAGALGEVLKQLAQFLEREAQLRADVATAMAYPVLVLGLATVIMAGVLGILMPKILVMVSDLVPVLPWPTRVMLGVGRWAWVFAPVVAGVIIAWRVVRRTENGRLWIDGLKLRIPVIGPAIRQVAIGRFARTLGVLAGSGVPILESLAIAAGASGNARISRAVDNARANVKGGASLASQLEEAGEFPALLVNMTAVGEETGKLDTVLLEAADAYDREVATAIARLNALLPPILIVIVGVIIGFAVLAALLPIFQATGGLNVF